PPAEVADQALRLIDRRLANRQKEWNRAALALRCLGAVSCSRDAFAVVSLRGQPRFVVPHRPSVSVSKLYRPESRAKQWAARAFGGSIRWPLHPGRDEVSLDVSKGLLPALERAL